LNNLILEILPLIEKITKEVSRNADQQNELRQICILKCYDYESLVKRLHAEKRLSNWLFHVIKNDYLALIKNEVIDSSHLKDIEDVVYCDRLEEIKSLLTHSERAWLNAYIKDGNYSNIHKRTGIQAAYVSERIKCVIEKCKLLKSTLL